MASTNPNPPSLSSSPTTLPLTQNFVPLRNPPPGVLSRLYHRSRIHHSQLSTASKDIDPSSQRQPHRLEVSLSLCNTILGGIGLISALSFGVVTIVQANIANKEAKLANEIAHRAFQLSMYQTCVQGNDDKVEPFLFIEGATLNERIRSHKLQMFVNNLKLPSSIR